MKLHHAVRAWIYFTLGRDYANAYFVGIYIATELDQLRKAVSP